MSADKIYEFYVEHFYQDQMRRDPTGCAVMARASARTLVQVQMDKIPHSDVVTCGPILEVLAQTPEMDKRKKDILKGVFKMLQVDASWKVEDLYALWCKVTATPDTMVVVTPPRSTIVPKMVTHVFIGETLLQEVVLDFFMGENEAECAAYERYINTQIRKDMK